jgi:prepilin-type N-terminal cleavage/methylation domain-containing protein
MSAMTISTISSRGRRQAGFTLPELMVACALVGIVLAGTFVAMKQGANAYEFTSGRVEVQETGRVALDRMMHDLRSGSTVTAATANSITFNYIDETLTTVTVTYSLSGTDLQRNQTNPVPTVAQPETLIGGVNTFALVYYDSNNVVTTTVANIRVVDIRLITQPQVAGLSPADLANQRATFEDRVRLRNL